MSLPSALQGGIARLAEGISRRPLALRSGRISADYRARRTSASVGTTDDVLAYALSRLPATYAANEDAMARLIERAPDFAPRTLLDLGCGPGTASWAALEAFPSIEQATLVDSNANFLTVARDLAADHAVLAGASFVGGNLAAPLAGRFDLVVVSYALTELSDPAAAIDRIWESCGGVLLVVEPGTPRDHQRLMSVRSRLIERGAELAAPCPHLAPCPVIAPDWCHFTVRLSRTRDHMRMKGGTLGYEDEKFSYIAATRPDAGLAPARPRVLARPVETKFDLTLKLCNTDGSLTHRAVPKRDAAAYRAVRKAEWGDAV